MAGRIVGILPDSTPLDGKAWELEQFFLKDAALLGRQLCHEHLGRILGVTRVLSAVAHISHPLHELLLRNAQRTAEVKCIKIFHLARYKRHVIGRLVENEQFAVAVVNGSAGRVLYLVEESIAVGIALVLVRKNLKTEQAHNVQKDDQYYDRPQHILSLFKCIVFRHQSIYILPVTCHAA